MSLDSHAAKTRKFWGDAARGLKKGDFPVHWLESDLVLRHCVNPLVSGKPNANWLDWIHAEYAPDGLERGLVLGCGGGQLERRAASLGICKSFIGIDISAEAIEVARALAEREGWTQFLYRVEDANKILLESESLDLILSDMALHHIEKLEYVLEQFGKALRPTGLLVLNEFVGPNRFQWTDLQLNLATETIRSLPLRLRRNRNAARWKRFLKPWIRRAKRWSPEKVERMDPSESIRSQEIPDLVKSRFEMLAHRPYGGTILALVLNNIVGNFTESEEDIAILKRLSEREENLIASGQLPSDYQLIVARKQLK